MECLLEIACTRPAFISYMTTQQTHVTVWAISTAKVEVFLADRPDTAHNIKYSQVVLKYSRFLNTSKQSCGGNVTFGKHFTTFEQFAQ